MTIHGCITLSPTQKTCSETAYRTRRDDPSSGQRQLDFVFASESIADFLTVRALNGEDEWGPSDHCRVLVEIDEAVVELTWELGRTPLIIASKHGRFDVCKYLITRKKTDVNKKDRFGYSALHVAAQRNYSDIVNILLSTEVKEL